MQQLELSSTYAVDHNTTNNGAEKEDARNDISVNALPYCLRNAIKYNANSSFKMILVISFLCNNCFSFLFLVGITRSVTIGSILVIYASVGSILSVFTPPNYMDPKNTAILSLIRDKASHCEKRVKGTLVFTIVTTIPFYIIAMYVLVLPVIAESLLLGPNSYIICWILMIVAMVSVPIVAVGMSLNLVFVEVQKAWNTRIEIYLKQIRQRLLETNIDIEADAKDTIKAIAHRCHGSNFTFFSKILIKYSLIV
jgi:hypothetical protein